MYAGECGEVRQSFANWRIWILALRKLVWGVVAAMVPAAMGAQAFVHPGVLVSGRQLDFVKQQVQQHKEPIYSEYQKAVKSRYAALDYVLMGPPADGDIDCGPYSKPDRGCHAEDSDATAAYLQAVLWWVSGDKRYAENSIRIMNAYSHGVKKYTNKNAPLQAAWAGEVWPRAAEIIRYSNAGWKNEDIKAFAAMLTKINLPLIHNGSGGNGNWELSMVEAMLGIAVFTEDRALYKHAEAMWLARVPGYFYNDALDKGQPRKPADRPDLPSWYGQSVFDKSTDGVAQETCRDLGHTGYGIAATMDAAETAHIQGDKLYETEAQRLMQTMEFHAPLYLHRGSAPKNVCGGDVKPGNGYTFAIGYNHFHNRMGHDLPLTSEWLDHLKTAEEPVDIHMMVFELLTHGANAEK